MKLAERRVIMAEEVQMRQPQRGVTFEDVWATLQESSRMHDRMIAEHDRMIAEHERQFEKDKAEHKAQMKDLREKMGDLVHSFGDVAEHLVAPGIAKKFNALGFHFDSIAPGGKKILDERGNPLIEIDLLLENGEYSVAVEVKSKPKVEDIKEHVNRLKVLRHYMDKHHDHRVIQGAIAGAIFHEGVKRAAIKAGLYAIVQSGDTMQIDVPASFTPREW
jgi:hypothetical protein